MKLIKTISKSTFAISRELDCLNTLAKACRMAGTHRVAEQIERAISEIGAHLHEIDGVVEFESMNFDPRRFFVDHL